MVAAAAAAAAGGLKLEDAEMVTEYSSLTVVKLQAELKKRSLPTLGKKVDLVARLKESDV